ncbi:MAG: glycosyltransferase family 2 protein [Staphylococcus sp.]|nr:glycosyltransferase family 2 protein [Staphylococcus sp.]
MKCPQIAIIVPCYNEEAVLASSVERLQSVLDRMTADGLVSSGSYIVCCDDGSTDATWQIIERLHLSDSRVKGISLAHNRGHQNVLLAGLMAVRGKCDAAISIDADLQDDPEAMVEMVRQFTDGKEIVYGVRNKRESDTWFKRTTAKNFYRFQRMMGVDAVYNHADYRLMSARAIELLADYGESNLFLRGIIPQIGLSHADVRYDRHPRLAGETKYPLAKMLSFSIDGITSFSARPMRIVFFTGLALLIIDIIVAAYVVASILFSEHLASGWTSLILSVWFLGSLILMAIGIVGEYIGKIFIEVKQRPRYAIRSILFD